MATESVTFDQIPEFTNVEWQAFNRLHAPEDEMDLVRQMVNRGHAALYRINDCYLVVRLNDRIDGGKDFVIVAIQGENLKSIAAFVQQWARDNGADRIRCHTRQQSMVRLVKQILPGTHIIEYVYEVPL